MSDGNGKALAVVQRGELAPGEFGPEDRQLIVDTYCQGATDAEVKLFFAICRQTGLSPLARQIFAVKRWNKVLGREAMSIQTSIDGYRLVAQRTGQYDGRDGPFWCGDSGGWCDAWLREESPVAARVVVYRRDASHGFTGIATYRSFCQRGRDGKPTSFWAAMADVMLAKCAEAAALRAAFPQELSGIYTREEMVQAEVADEELAPPVGRLEPTSKPPLCDARRWQSRWFATVSGTRFASSVERHEFVRSISRDVTSSLGEYLSHATENQAAALIAALEEAIADDKQARAIPTKSEQVGNNACWICGAVADEKGWAARCRERTRSTVHREGVLLCVPHATEWNAMLTADKAEPHTKAADGFLAELVRVWATEHREQDEPEEAEA